MKNKLGAWNFFISMIIFILGFFLIQGDSIYPIGVFIWLILAIITIWINYFQKEVLSFVNILIYGKHHFIAYSGKDKGTKEFKKYIRFLKKEQKYRQKLIKLLETKNEYKKIF